jgi:predicted oxidoreductase
MRKVCWKEIGDGVSSSTSSVRDMIKSPNKKPEIKVPKGLSISKSSPEDEKFLPRLQKGWNVGPPGAYEAWIQKHRDEVKRVQGHLNQIRDKEKQLGRKYSDKKIREMLDIRGMIEARDRDIRDPKTNQKYLAGLEADKKKLEDRLRNLEEG